MCRGSASQGFFCGVIDSQEHGQQPSTGEGPLHLVTRHRGGNRMKSFDVYEAVDQIMGEPAWHGRIVFI